MLRLNKPIGGKNDMNRTTKSFIALTCITILCAIAIPAIIADTTVNTTRQITAVGHNATHLITIEIGDVLHGDAAGERFK